MNGKVTLISSLIACVLEVGCANHSYHNYGPSSDVSQILRLERTHFIVHKIDTPIDVYMAVIGNSAGVAPNLGEGFFTSVYIKRRGKWVRAAQTGDAATICPFLKVGVLKQDAQKIVDELYQIVDYQDAAMHVNEDCVHPNIDTGISSEILWYDR